MKIDKRKRWKRRKRSIRKKIFGTSERPRLSVNKSNRNLYAQVIDDIKSETICSSSTLSPEVAEDMNASTRKNINFAKELGKTIAAKAQEKGVKKIVFDRSGYQYHGVIKALAESARENGLEF